MLLDRDIWFNGCCCPSGKFAWAKSRFLRSKAPSKPVDVKAEEGWDCSVGVVVCSAEDASSSSAFAFLFALE